VPDVPDDLVPDQVEGGFRVIASGEDRAALRQQRVEGTGLVPRLADPVGVEQDLVARAERPAVRFPGPVGQRRKPERQSRVG
jgi:hypothetical protein